MLDSTAATAPPRTVPRLPSWALVPVSALVFWVCGFLPWLLEGAGRAAPLALPLRAGSLTLLVLGAAVGGVLGGLTGLLGRSGRRARALLATGAGTGLALLATLGQSVAAAGRGSGFDADSRVLVGLCAVAVATTALAWAAGSLALAGRPGAGVALGLLAGVLPGWLSSLLPSALLSGGFGGTALAWVQAAALAGALVAVGVRPAARLGWWPLVVLVAWSVGPVLTAVGYLEPSLRPGAGLPRGLGDALSGAWQVLWLSASPLVRHLAPWVAAVVVAAFVSVLLAGRRSQPADATG
ncbi:hypothetical protein GCU56_11370 [Geodermatophilus sabuli]|uniref:Uncharacterized protein n=1 Tax=Geodermatophilus sabuli TaxID=1564158 RepID=A0A7K3W294_9ACTN|nr:hypothetical protein [Geodermatophilus sabuli]NEK58473.1 hypothetical protein [Geodermatophilus sabuli]